MKRDRIQKGLEVLLRAGLAEVEPTATGISFRASERAASFVRLMETDNAKALSDRADWVVDHFGALSDSELREAMRAASGHWAEEFDSTMARPSEADL
ncbi:hypothetical protein G7075_15290 [Phycicoccus sp. HDW14]|nr:ABC-three component system middle component 2 [Phycicoccus sp. HDW14]QIM22183.1 hypothetical protein G7075_15290 [Phycicoccus sp. HDW14]